MKNLFWLSIAFGAVFYSSAQTVHTHVLRGYVKDIHGHVPSGVCVELSAKQGSYLVLAYAVPNPEGHFIISHLSEGRYKVSLLSEKYGTQTFDSVMVTGDSLYRLELTFAYGNYMVTVPPESVHIPACELRRFPDYHDQGFICGMSVGINWRNDEVSHLSPYNDFQLYIDGMKMRHTLRLPTATIQEMEIWFRGIPANLDSSP